MKLSSNKILIGLAVLLALIVMTKSASHYARNRNPRPPPPPPPSVSHPPPPGGCPPGYKYEYGSCWDANNCHPGAHWNGKGCRYD